MQHRNKLLLLAVEEDVDAIFILLKYFFNCFILVYRDMDRKDVNLYLQTLEIETLTLIFTHKPITKRGNRSFNIMF